MVCALTWLVLIKKKKGGTFEQIKHNVIKNISKCSELIESRLENNDLRVLVFKKFQTSLILLTLREQMNQQSF